MQRPSDEERRAFALRELARAAESPARTAATLARARVHFVETLAGRDAARMNGVAGSPWSALLLGFAAAVVMVSVALLVKRAQHGAEPRAGAAVTYAVEGIPGAIGAWHSAPASSSLSLRFSEGTNLLLSANASLRVVQTDEHGATVALERGQLHARVEHRDGTRWAVDAGPYHVRVTGTEFDVEWDPAAGSFGIQLSAGSVQVTGCNAAGTRVARGESLRLHCESSKSSVDQARGGEVEESKQRAAAERVAEARPDGEDTPPRALPPTSLTDLPKATEPSRPRAPSPSAEVATPAKPAPAPPKAAGSAAIDEHPADRESPEAGQQHTEPPPAAAPASTADAHPVCERDPARVRAALTAALESGTADATWAAIQCVRRAGFSTDAEDALRAFRDRYSSDTRRATAAFLLGKLAFGRDAFALAARWFEASRREAPGGQLARESAGRLIEAWQRAGNNGAAIRASREYLSAYPEGPHARLARSLLAP